MRIRDEQVAHHCSVNPVKYSVNLTSDSISDSITQDNLPMYDQMLCGMIMLYGISL